MKELKSLKGSKKLNMQEICKILGEKQKNGELVHHTDFSTAKPDTIAHLWYRLKKDFENEE